MSIVFRAGVARLTEAGLRSSIATADPTTLAGSAGASSRLTAGLGLA
jgi:hypothetical protein